MLLLDQGPAETSAYLIAGYVVIFGGLFLYLLSLIIRTRKLIKEMKRLQDDQI